MKNVMNYKVVGQSHLRRDAIAKVTGEATYTDDIPFKKKLHGKICRATIAHGIVKRLDISQALKVEGVVKILTPDDLPQTQFPTAGHPYALTERGRDIADRNLLTKKVRQYGDEIAAVIAETELAAKTAASKIIAEYEELPFYLTPEEAMGKDAVEIHDCTKNNILASNSTIVGDFEEGFRQADEIVEAEYHTQTVQHCHIESNVAVAYKDYDGRWVCVSSTQIPHIVRRIIGQALEIPWGTVRVIKPAIGGGFGNKQDSTIEPLVVAMSMAVGGRPVRLALDREESLAYTRVRHAIHYRMKAGVTKDGRFTSLKVEAVSNGGAYASHGHSVTAKGAGIIVGLYKIPNMHYTGTTVYTNAGVSGAMRGYGTPQVIFAIESLVDKICNKMGFDPMTFRLNNILHAGDKHPLSNIVQYTYELDECLKQGRKAFRWEEKKAGAEAARKQGVKRGVGVAAFAYPTAVYPYSLEIAGCRLVLNQDASVKLMLGATEIGQGSDTVLAQMVAETLSIPFETVYADQMTDTDVMPFDTGSYASRQAYVTGMAVRKAAEELKGKILSATERFHDIKKEYVDIKDGNIVYKHNGEVIEPLSDLVLKTYYDWDKAECLTADVSVNCHTNSYPTGATFAEVEVDEATGKIKILSMLNAHDIGVVLNPLLAGGQVDGGMGMGVGYCIGEELRYDTKTGKPLNNNLLDYKIPTFMDIPDLDHIFVETQDPFGPYGNKGLGETSLCSPAAAIRNAVFNATGIEYNAMPLMPQRVFEEMEVQK